MSNPNFNFHTTAEQVTSLYAAEISSKTILITGLSPNSLGLATALAIAPHSPALLILASHTPSSLSAAASEILAHAPACAIKTLHLDLSSIAAVRAAATELLSWPDVSKIDVLINNAGIMACPFALSADGFERQFAVNYLGMWVFTQLVMERLVAAAEGNGKAARVVNLSSVGHLYGDMWLDHVDLGCKGDGEGYDADVAYGRSKTAGMLMAVALEGRTRGRVRGFSVHPGMVFTGLSRYMTPEYLKGKGFMDEEGNLTIDIPSKTHSQGAATTLVAALDPGIADRSGSYLADCQIVEVGDQLAEYAQNRDNAEKLWDLTENLLGEKFPC